MTQTQLTGAQIADGASGVNLGVDVTGTLPVGNGGTGVTTSTGTGATVLGTSPQFTGGIGINTPTNATVGAVINTASDTRKGLVVFANSATQSATLLEAQNSAFTPVFTVSPTGVVTATSINKVAITAPATSATLTIANLGTLATSGAFSITLTATATTNVTLPTSGTLLSNANNNVPANALATNAITLGYASITANFATSSATAVYATGLGVSCTIPAGSRKVKITGFIPQILMALPPQYAWLYIYSGATVGTLTTQLQKSYVLEAGANANNGTFGFVQIIDTPSAGTLAYSIAIASGSGSATIVAASGAPAYIHVEAV